MQNFELFACTAHSINSAIYVRIKIQDLKSSDAFDLHCIMFISKVPTKDSPDSFEFWWEMTVSAFLVLAGGVFAG